MQCCTSRFLRLASFRINPRGLAVRAVLLHLASRDVGKRGIAEERQEMDADVLGLRAYISRIAFAQRDNLDLAGERLSGVFETVDRKSVVSGKSVSVRVDLGGRRT